MLPLSFCLPHESHVARAMCLGQRAYFIGNKDVSPKHKKLLLMCGVVDQICFRVHVFCAAPEEL